MRHLQEIFQDAKLVHHLQRGRMHRVAAEVAEEVLVLLPEAGHDHTDAVGSDDPQQVRLRRGEHLLLKLEPVLSSSANPAEITMAALVPRAPSWAIRAGT